MHFKTLFLFAPLLVIWNCSSAQIPDSIKKIHQFSGSAAVTNNGISLIPTFTLGKPAALVNMSLVKSKFSFDPELTFSLYDGKPWYFLLWLRYKIANTAKFKLTAGTHLGLNFKRMLLPLYGDSNKALLTDRYLVAELAPSYSISKNISAGIYYLLSHGLDIGTANATHFITLNANFSHIKLTDQFYMKLIPQCYYLNIDGKDGFYFTSSLTLVRTNFPFSLSSVVNKAIKTDIAASQHFVWNVSMIYSFGKKYIRL